MTTHIALLRGINLGARNKVPKATLFEVFLASGATDVRTYIQSGNVLYRTANDDEATAIGERVSAALHATLGLTVPVVTLTVAGLAGVIAANPFAAAGHPDDQLHALFLAATPTPEAVARLDPDHGGADRFTVVGRAIYLWLPNGAARSRLSNDWFDRRLGVVSTARNWRTTRKLLELAADARRT